MSLPAGWKLAEDDSAPTLPPGWSAPSNPPLPEGWTVEETAPTSSLAGDLAKRAGRSMVRMPGEVVQGAGTALDAAGRLVRAFGAGQAAAANLQLPAEVRDEPQAPTDAMAQQLKTATPAGRTIAAVGREMRARPTFAGVDVGYTGDLAPDPARDSQILSQAADSVGSLAAAMATPGGLLTKTATGALLQSGSQAEQAREWLLAKGAGEDAADAEAARQFVFNLPAGAVESVAWGRLLGQFGPMNLLNAVNDRFGKTAAQRIARTTLEQMGIEGAEEVVQQLWGNLTARSYNPKQELTEGVREAGAVGMLMGGGTGATLQSAAEIATKLDTGANVPERPEDLQAQQQQLVKGDRPAQMFPTGTDELPLPKGMQRVETPRGVFHFDPRKITADEILSASAKGEENRVLGLGPYSKPEVMRRAAAGEPIATLTERGPEGEELRGAVVTPSTVDETRAAMEAGKSAGSAVQLERLPDTLLRRSVADDIERSLPDAESKDYVRGRNAQDVVARAKETTDLPALWQETVDAVVASGATPAQLRALQSTLGVLTDAKARKEAGLRGLKVSRERIANVLSGTALDGAVRGSTFAKLVDALARQPENIAALRDQVAATLDAATPSSAPPASSLRAAPGTTTASATPAPAALKASRRSRADIQADIDATETQLFQLRENARPDQDVETEGRALYLRIQDLRRELAAAPRPLREQILAEAAQQKSTAEELARKKATADKVQAEAKAQRDAETKRLEHIDRTGRDPESGLIVDLRKVPSAELEGFDWEKDRYLQSGDEVRPEDIDAVLMQRARDEERTAATPQSFTLLDLLKGRRDALRAAGLSSPLRLMSPKEARERGTYAGEHAALRERTGGFAYFARDGLAEDRLQQQLAELGFNVPDVAAAYDLVERAMKGQDVRPMRDAGGAGNVQFARRTAGTKLDFSRRLQGSERAEITRFADEWWKNLERLAPGLAKDAELRITKADDLVEAGLAAREDLTGDEEAARLRDTKARREIFYLFEQALRSNTPEMTRRNLLHEMGHAYWDTLDLDAQTQMLNRWEAEMRDKTGPLFDENGQLREGVALGVEEDIQEWFAERLAHANDSWAKRRIEARSKGDSLLATIAAKFRALLVKMREFVSRHLDLEGYDDALLANFRLFLDQGTKWGAQNELAANYARRENDGMASGDGAAQQSEGSPQSGPELRWPIEEDADRLAVLLEQIGLPVYRSRSTISGSQYVETRIAGEDGSITIKFRVSNHELPSYYQAADIDVGPMALDSAEDAIGLFARRYGIDLPSNVAALVEAKRVEKEKKRETWEAQASAAEKAYRERAELAKHAWAKMTNEQRGEWIDLMEKPGARVARQSFRRKIENALGYAEGSLGATDFGISRTTLAMMRQNNEAGGVETPTGFVESDGLTGRSNTATQSPRNPNLPRSSGAAQFARRASPGDFDAALREFDRLERERDAILERDGRVPRELLAQLSESRMTLENSWPGWRERRAEQRAQDEANAIQPPEPEKGVTAADDTGREVRPEATRAKISALMASHYRPASSVRTWLENIGRMFTNFRSDIPELPGGAKGREFTSLRQGNRMLKAATEFVRREAADRIAHVVQPILDLPGDNVSPNEYRRLVNLQAAIKSLEENADTPAEYLKAAPKIQKLSAELDAIETKLETLPYHLFRKIVLLRDLWFRGKLLNLSGEPITLPFNLTREGVEQDLQRLHQKLAESPHRTAIEEALRRHYALVKSTREDLLARGYVIPEELRNPLYFPHLILDKFNGRVQRVKMDTAEDFRGYLQQLTGSAKDIETDYLTAMYYHMGQVLAHNARQDIVETYWQPYDIKPWLEQEAERINAEREEQGLGPIVWQQLVPKDHVVYTVDDRIPLRPEYTINRRVLAERLGVELGDGDLQAQLRELGLNVTITAEDVRLAMAAGEKTRWVIPREVAAALDGIMERETKSRDQLRRALALPQSAWKWWKLFSPTSVIRYTYGNLVADLEKLFSVDPKVFTYLLPAFREVKDFASGGAASADLREAFLRGVLQSPTAAETGDLVKADRFESFLSSREKLLNNLARGVQWGAYVNGLRESAFRYAKFKADLDRLRSGRRPIYAGAYGPDVEAITGPDADFAKAAEIARKTFVDYEAISVSGDALRKYWVPFYSWAEGNFRYHANLFRNLRDMSAGAGVAQLARGSLVGASKAVLPRSVTGVLLRLALPYVAVALWNTSGDRDEIEKDLSEEDRRRFHIILGRDQNGKAIVAYAPTALADVMEWFGGNEFARLGMEYASGRITFDQLVHEWLANTPRQTLNKAAQGTNPFFKTTLEFVSRKGYFPDVTDARSIADHDMAWHILGSMTDITTADWIRRAVDADEYSSRTIGEQLQQIVLQARRRDPEQWGFYATLDKIDEWKLAHGKGGYEPGADNRPDAQVLRSFRRAIRNADVPAALEFYHRLLDAGYTAERFAASVRIDPLQSLPRAQREAFVESLSPAERHNLTNAYRYWQRMEAFRNKERRLFPSEKASAAFKARFAENPRDDVFAGIMVEAAERDDAEEEMRAEKLLQRATRPR